ncbi:MAG: tetratricopeptide repeat protein [Candidatus Rokuibacteriota bacterium]|jgi:tetratricopeptide (TPR) repeat protein|nr:tetratricopeptide repeat protein [Patescibacteria group bacterium]
MTLGVAVVLLLIGVPALAFVLWPLRARGGGASAALLPLPPDAREQLDESKRAALRALRELEFEHASGHVGDADYADLRARYESEAAAILSELDRLEPAHPAEAPTPTPAVEATIPRRGWRHPVAVTVGVVALVTFGVVLGVGIVRFTEPESSMAGAAGARGPMMEEPSAANAPRGPVTPAMLEGMLGAARQSLYAGRYNEAMRAYQAVLKRDPNNVDALTHLGLMAGIAAQGQHGPEMVERALDLFDRALKLDPEYPPALLYRGQVLYEVRKDVPGAIRSWEKFVKVSPPGEDRERVVKMIADARAQAGGKR